MGKYFYAKTKNMVKDFQMKVERGYYWAVNDGSKAILEFMGISDFKILEEVPKIA